MALEKGLLYEIEQAILARLRLYMQGVARVENFPADFKAAGRPTVGSRLLVGYARSTFKKIAEQPVTLEQIAQFEVGLQLVGIASHSDSLPVLDRIRFALTGFVPVVGYGVRPMFPANEAFKKLDEALWMWAATFSCPLKVIAGQDPAADYSPLPPIQNGVEMPSLPGNLTEPIFINEFRIGLWRSADFAANPDRTVLDTTLVTAIDPQSENNP